MGHKHQSQNAESYVKLFGQQFHLMRLMLNCVLHFPVDTFPVDIPPPHTHTKKNVFRYVNCLKLDFQNVDQHARGKRLIQGTKHIKDNRLQCLELQCRIT